MDSAIDYVTAGWALISIPKGKKGPTTKGWNEKANAITDPERAGELNGNIGLAHAYCSPFPTMALDLDDMERASAWLAARGIDVAELLDADDAVQIVSGRIGRGKLLYRLPSGLNPIESLTIKEAANVDGEEKQITVLEFRCGTVDGLTMQDVLPPSIHPDTGTPYRWDGKGDRRQIPEIPAALLAAWQQELVARQASRAQRKDRQCSLSRVEDTPRQRARLAEMLGHISADCSYELYRDMVWAILSLGWHDGEDIAEAWCLTAPEEFKEASFWNVVNSYDPNRYPAPTIGTIIFHARAGGWNG
jgi:putative DNA primase/helicase